MCKSEVEKLSQMRRLKMLAGHLFKRYKLFIAYPHLRRPAYAGPTRKLVADINEILRNARQNEGYIVNVKTGKPVSASLSRALCRALDIIAAHITLCDIRFMEDYKFSARDFACLESAARRHIIVGFQKEPNEIWHPTETKASFLMALGYYLIGLHFALMDHRTFTIDKGSIHLSAHWLVMNHYGDYDVWGRKHIRTTGLLAFCCLLGVFGNPYEAFCSKDSPFDMMQDLPFSACKFIKDNDISMEYFINVRLRSIATTLSNVVSEDKE